MFLLIDKPKGISSHDVINIIRKITGVRRVGHGGTLDPNATGLLLIGVGREATKKLSSVLLGQDKVYEAVIILGEERETDDVVGMLREPEKIPIQVRSSHGTNSERDDKVALESLPTLSNIKAVLKGFIGKQMQMPPIYSAKKIKGKPAYKLARKGINFNLKPKEVEIYTIKLLSYEYPLIKIRTKVSSGTYIRSLARDIGRKLGTGAYLGDLRRVKIGKYDINKAVKIENLNEEHWKVLLSEV